MLGQCQDRRGSRVKSTSIPSACYFCLLSVFNFIIMCILIFGTRINVAALL